jgi:hypothetical protein
MKKPTKFELAILLGISEEDFHREIKPLIKRQFKEELLKIMDKTDNPDIWLDYDNNIVLVNPKDMNKQYPTGISIFSYK